MMRPSRSLPSDLWLKSPIAALDYEIAQEKASALGRLGRALEAALQALAEFDTAHPAPAPAERQARFDLVAAAGHVLWQVHRPAGGVRTARRRFGHAHVSGAGGGARPHGSISRQAFAIRLSSPRNIQVNSDAYGRAAPAQSFIHG